MMKSVMALARDGERDEDPTFVLNQEPYRQANILVAGENFGQDEIRFKPLRPYHLRDDAVLRWRKMPLSLNRPCRLREKVEWSGTLPSSPRRKNQRYARFRCTSSHSRRSERIPMQ
jgi:hypothetical protein